MLEPGHHLLGPRRARRQAAHQPKVLEDVGQALRFERYEFGLPAADARGALHKGIGDGAYLAELLGQDQIGLERREAIGIEPIDAAPLMDELTDVAVDVGAPSVAGQQAASHDRLAPHLLRVIALVSHSHQAVFQAKRAHDLGGAGQEGGDPHISRRARTG